MLVPKSALLVPNGQTNCRTQQTCAMEQRQSYHQKTQAVIHHWNHFTISVTCTSQRKSLLLNFQVHNFFSLGLFTVLIVGNLVSLFTGRQKVDDLKQGVLTPLYSRSFLCKWMPKNVREKATPPSHCDIFADVVHNEAFDGEENEMEEKSENKYADL